MAIKIWQSYSCNNSSSFRLVARFANAATAATAAADLDAFFKAYAIEMDALVEADDYTWPDAWPPGAEKFAAKYGFKLDRNPIGWGDEGLTGDEPELLVEGDTVLVYHSYSGGFGKTVPAYLTARGATSVGREETTSPWLGVLFPYAGGNAELETDLEKLFAQGDAFATPLETPWKSRRSYGGVAFYRDAKTVGMVFPFVPSDLPEIRGWLAKHRISQPSLTICDRELAAELLACKGATCEACNGALELWHPRLRDVETAQMACVTCGGLYEMSTLLAAAKKRERATARAEQKLAVAKPASKQPAKSKAKPAKKQPAKKQPAKSKANPVKKQPARKTKTANKAKKTNGSKKK